MKNLMKEKWNQRAQRDAFYYVESAFWNGDTENFFKLGEERAKLIIDPVIAQLNFPANNSCAVEIGCGLGRFSRALAKRFASVIGVDVSEEMVSKAQKLSPSQNYPNLSFCSTDGESLLCLFNDSVDFVFSYEVFQHMPSYEVISNNILDIARVLKPTGIAFIHLRTEPVLSLYTIKKFAKKIFPESVWISLGFKPFTFDSTWTGTALSRNDINQLCKLANLKILQLITDPTHSSGERVFLLATPIQDKV